MLTPGDPAPPFSLEADDGSTVSLDDLKGSRFVLYFYPKDDTPGCTAQASALRDGYAEIEAAGARVLGVSPDDGSSHRRFREKYGLPFQLLSDPDHRIAEAYGAWGEKQAYGRTSVGILRSSFVVDEQGRIIDARYRVKPEDTAPRALGALAQA